MLMQLCCTPAVVLALAGGSQWKPKEVIIFVVGGATYEVPFSAGWCSC